VVRNPQAICIRCGHFKARALTRCGNCRFVPVTADDSTRSLVLSRPFDVEAQLLGLTPPELRAAARQIQGGQAYEFDPAMLARVAAHHHVAEAAPLTRRSITGVLWLMPLLLILGIVLALVLPEKVDVNPLIREASQLTGAWQDGASRLDLYADGRYTCSGEACAQIGAGGVWLREGDFYLVFRPLGGARGVVAHGGARAASLAGGGEAG